MRDSWRGTRLLPSRLYVVFLKKNILFLLFLHLEARRAQAKISGIIGLKRFHILSLSRRLLVKKVDSVLSGATRLVTVVCMTGVKETPQK